MISVVLPAHNEAQSLPTTVAGVLEALAEEHLEIVIVDDGSTDDTWQVLQDLRKRHAEIRALRFTRNFGAQTALYAGLDAARGDAVITMDADGQHPPSLLPELIARWRVDGVSVVQAVREGGHGEGLLKRWSSRAFYSLHNLLAGVAIVPGSADFRLLDRDTVDLVLASSGSVLFLRGLIPWLGVDAAYVAYHAAPRLAGSRSYTWWHMIRLGVDATLSFSVMPLRLAILLGLMVSALSLVYLVYIVTVFMVSDQVVPGWASMTGLLALLGGIQLLTVGVLGEYVGRLFLASLRRPRFVVRERLGESADD